MSVTRVVAGLAIAIAACQPPPPAQSPCPPQTVYVAAQPQQQPESQPDIAARLDAEGERLSAAGRYAEASAKHREAVARVPDPKYFFHLCQSLFHEGKYAEALTACVAVDNNAPIDLARDARALSKRIQTDASAHGIYLTEPAPPKTPRGTTQEEIAAKLDDEGDKLFAAGKFAEASAKHRDAIARDPDAVYFFHLCRSLHREGKFSEALVACDAANRNGPVSGVRTKIDALIQTIKSDARAQGIDLRP